MLNCQLAQKFKLIVEGKFNIISREFLLVVIWILMHFFSDFYLRIYFVDINILTVNASFFPMLKI